jgi:hypothetical protein
MPCPVIMIKNHLILLLLISALSSCSFNAEYIVEDPNTRDPARIESVKKKYRIALIGFYPYKKIAIDSYRDRSFTFIKTQSVIDYDNSMKAAFALGMPIEDVPENGQLVEVPVDTIKTFVDTYMTRVNETGKDEMSKIITEKNGTPVIRGRDVDYYLVGIYQPHFNRLSESKKHLSNFTLFLYNITFGTIPLIHHYKKTSLFYLYDRNLNLLKKFEYAGVYKLKSAWWVTQNPEGNKFTSTWKSEVPPGYIWKPDLTLISDDLIRFLDSQ